MTLRFGRRIIPLIVFPVIFAGCSNYEDRIPVSGRVLLDGEPIKDGFVSFVGTEGYAVASGQIRDGQYSLSESASRVGISPGEYAIRFEAWKEKPGEELPKGGFSKGVSAIPDKYLDAAKSGLTAKVTEKDRKFDFELSSAK